jgi:hypothetical protein
MMLRDIEAAGERLPSGTPLRIVVYEDRSALLGC